MGAPRSGQEAVLAWPGGTLSCTIVATVQRAVLLRPEDEHEAPPAGACSLTFWDGPSPAGFDGRVEASAHPEELRFWLDDPVRGGERRQHARVPASATVAITCEDGAEVEAQLLDISSGGARVRHQHGLGARGSQLRVVTKLPGGLWVDADAVVCEAEIGVCTVRFVVHHASGPQMIGGWAINQLRRALAA